MTSRQRAPALSEDSPLNTVGARLAPYAALAGAAAISIALRRHSRNALTGENAGRSLTLARAAISDPISDSSASRRGAGMQAQGQESKANWPSPGARSLPGRA